jgi:hypothetical protein
MYTRDEILLESLEGSYGGGEKVTMHLNVATHCDSDYEPISNASPVMFHYYRAYFVNFGEFPVAAAAGTGYISIGGRLNGVALI